MRMLVLGAGALGGYFGGRALERGVDVTFLVRPRRAEQLARDGLVVESPVGAMRRPVPFVTEAGPGYDAVLLTAKAYDLDAAIAAIRPAVEAGACVLPVLNGMAHMDALNAAFGRDRVWGGLARISATLTPDGVIRHFGTIAEVIFGEQDGRMDGRAAALAAAIGSDADMKAEAIPDIASRMWEKLVTLGSLATGTVLFRAPVGDIVRAGGSATLLGILDSNAAIAAAHGHPPREAVLEATRKTYADPASTFAASLLRDLEAGGPTEADHILGWLADAGERVGVPAPLQRAAWLHVKSQEQRRAREA